MRDRIGASGPAAAGTLFAPFAVNFTRFEVVERARVLPAPPVFGSRPGGRPRRRPRFSFGFTASAQVLVGEPGYRCVRTLLLLPRS